MRLKIFEALEARDTGNRRPLWPTMQVREEYGPPDSCIGPSHAIEYRIEATFGSRSVIREGDSEMLHLAIQHAREKIAGMVFSDLRTEIMEVRDAVFNNDREEAIRRLGRINMLLHGQDVFP